jgi:predicted CoA-binding protein
MGFGSSTDVDIKLNTELSAEERARYQDSRAIQKLLTTAKTIAVVGASTEKTKASSMVASYVMDEGYEVYPVNPRAAEVLGVKCFPSLADIPVPVDIVVAFRPSPEVSRIAEEAIAIGAKCLWQQLRIINLEAADQAIEAGLLSVVDRCIKMEHGRYAGALHWAGMNTEVLTARRRRR